MYELRRKMKKVDPDKAVMIVSLTLLVILAIFVAVGRIVRPPELTAVVVSCTAGENPIYQEMAMTDALYEQSNEYVLVVEDRTGELHLITRGKQYHPGEILVMTTSER